MPVVEAYQKEGRCFIVNSNQCEDDVYADVKNVFLQLGEKLLTSK